jgi:DNA-directed RNA polymerase subunit RPC12/RpoP
MKTENNACPIACPVRAAGPPPWRYRCRACGAEFEMPAPKGPSEEKSRACPRCSSRDIEKQAVTRTEACPPGG